MTNEIYSLVDAGIEAWDLHTNKGRYAGLIVKQKGGWFRHYYNGNGTAGSTRKFPTIEAALDNVRARRARLAAKRAAA